MKDNLLVSGKGQVTLPVAMRRALGLGANTLVVAERKGNSIVLTPAMVVESEAYSDAEIEAWNRADEFPAAERAALTRKLKRGK